MILLDKSQELEDEYKVNVVNQQETILIHNTI